MATSAASHEATAITDKYAMLRHVFSEAMRSSVTDKRWGLSSCYTDPGRIVMTEYAHKVSSDKISCESFDHDTETGEYRKHLFKFSQGSDE